jgi:hypothetical protein
MSNWLAVAILYDLGVAVALLPPSCERKMVDIVAILHGQASGVVQSSNVSPCD